MSMNDNRNPRSISGYIEGLEDAKNIPQGFCNEYGYTTLEEAVRYAENGKCQLLLLLVCILAISSTSAFYTIMNLNLNVLQCEFELNYESRKSLNDVICICLMAGGLTSSLIADTMSRKWTLIANLVVNAIACGAISLVTHTKQFLYLRALISFTSSSITAITVTHLSEFLIRYYRGSAIVCLQIGWLLGVITIPFIISLWRYQVALTMIPTLFSAFLLLFFPDSPTFLFNRGRSIEALQALQFIFSVNTGKSNKEFPIRHLTENTNPFGFLKRPGNKHNASSGVEPKHVCILIILLSQYVFMFSYGTVTFWFPILNQRLPGVFPLFPGYQIPQDCSVGYPTPEEQTTGLRTFASEMLYKHTHRNVTQLITEETPEELCKVKEEPVFFKINIMSNIITCMPIMIFTILKIDSIGRKFFIMTAHFAAGCLTFGSFFMHTYGKDVLYTGVFDSLIIISIAVSECLAVELCSTRYRVLGVSFVSASRTFALMYVVNGGIFIPNLKCVVLFSLCAIALEISGILLMILPDTAGINLR